MLNRVYGSIVVALGLFALAITQIGIRLFLDVGLAPTAYRPDVIWGFATLLVLAGVALPCGVLIFRGSRSATVVWEAVAWVLALATVAWLLIDLWKAELEASNIAELALFLGVALVATAVRKKGVLHART